MRYVFLLFCSVCAAPVCAQSPYDTVQGWQLEVSPYEQGPAATLGSYANDNYMSITGLYRFTERLDARAQLGYTDVDSYVYGKLGVGWLLSLPQDGWSARFDISMASGARSDGFTGVRHVAEGRLAVFHTLKTSRDVHAFPGVFVAIDGAFERFNSVRYGYSTDAGATVPGGVLIAQYDTFWGRSINAWFGATVPAYIRVWRAFRVIVEPSLGFGSRSGHSTEFTLKAGGQYTF